jgi:hypothetical protein
LAHAARQTSAAQRPARDGAVRCELCGDRDHRFDHEWCPASETLVCDGCCDDLLRGEPRRVLAAAELATRTVTPLELIAECTACDRLSRMLVDEDEMLTVTSEEEPASIH